VAVAGMAADGRSVCEVAGGFVTACQCVVVIYSSNEPPPPPLLLLLLRASADKTHRAPGVIEFTITTTARRASRRLGRVADVVNVNVNVAVNQNFLTCMARIGVAR